jgi:hypothetical protein
MFPPERIVCLIGETVGTLAASTSDFMLRSVAIDCFSGSLPPTSPPLVSRATMPESTN